MALSDTRIRQAKPKAKPYKLVDGEGLLLLVQPNGSKLWRRRLRVNGVETMFAIGRYPDVTLAAARDAARHAARVAIIDAAGNAAWYAARHAIMALIAWDDCAHYLDLSSAKLEIWAKLSEKPECILLLPAVKAFEKIDEMELTA